MVAAFGAPSTVRDVCAGVPGLDRDVAETAVGLLAGAGLLDSVPDGADSADSADDAGSRGDAAVTAGWSFADLLFRTAGESDRRSDATRSAEPPPGAVTASPHGEYLGLARWTPREGRVLDVDALLDRRTSVRTYGEVPLSRADLGAFLDLAQTPQDTGLLEPAVVVRACTSLPSGLYRYRRASHALTTLAPWSPELDRLAGDATRSVDGTSSPVQVLVVLFATGLTAGTYADVLVDVGRRMQQMYLAAAMLGLAGCALGAGDSGAFARASGLDPLTHPSVGEFLLGSKAEETT
nr:nitroreductase family protein [Actinopolymorpha rutila]